MDVNEYAVGSISKSVTTPVLFVLNSNNMNAWNHMRRTHSCTHPRKDFLEWNDLSTKLIKIRTQMDDPDTQPTILQTQNKTNKTEQIQQIYTENLNSDINRKWDKVLRKGFRISITSRSKVDLVYCLFCQSFSSYVCTHASYVWLEGYEKRLKEVIKSEAVSRGLENTMSKQWY